MTAVPDIVFLIDCDDTLFDNDRLERDLHEHIARAFDAGSGDRYWMLLEQLRHEFEYVDYLGAVQRFRQENMSDPRVFHLASFLLDYPFASRLYDGALDVLAHLRTLGLTVILSDGDAVFQPRKLQRSGLWDAVDGRVMIPIHKERMLGAVATRYPARRYIMIDDKRRLLAAIKAIWADRVRTVFPRQGHYALDSATAAAYPAPDLTVERIRDLLLCDLAPLTDLA